MREQIEAAPAPTPAMPGVLRWLRKRLLPGGPSALMLAAYAIILTALVTFILSRRDLLPLTYYTVILLLSAMFVLHVVWPDLEQRLGHARAAWLHLGLNGVLFLVVNYLGFGGPTFSFLPFMLFMLCAQAVVDLPGRASSAYIATLFGGWMLIMVLRGFSPEVMLGNALSVSLGMIFAIILARVLKLAHEQTERAEGLLAELRAANAALAAAAGRERELAAAEERVRLARDIHDGLGHHLTVLNVQLQAAGKLIARDPARAAETIALCREEAQAALDEVRQSVATLRRSPLDGRSLPEAVAGLVRDFDRVVPLSASFSLRGMPTELGPSAAMTLYRAAQEGLTNAQKHAAARRVSVELAFAAGLASVRVRDDGSAQLPHDPAAPGGGFGLAGLRERAEQLGGTLSASPAADGGFLLEVSIPLTR